MRLMMGSRISKIVFRKQLSECSILSSNCWEPKLEVMINKAFLQLTTLPLLSVILPSSKFCSRMLKAILVGFFHPRQREPQHVAYGVKLHSVDPLLHSQRIRELIKRETLCFSMYSDMSKRMRASSPPKQPFCQCLGELCFSHTGGTR